MKAPVLCLDCREAYMELDLRADHQHLTCSGCGTVWCAVCIARVEVSISEKWLRQALAVPREEKWVRRARVPHLN